MRVYFSFNLPRQTELCHKMALHWRNQGKAKAFAGYYVEKQGQHGRFLKVQNDINYFSIQKYEDILSTLINSKVSSKEIRFWEKKLDFPLCQLIVADRNFGKAFNFGHLQPKIYEQFSDWETIQKLAVGFLTFFKKEIEEFSPDVILLPAMAALHSLALFHAAKNAGIPCIRMSSSPLPNRIILSTEPRFETQFWQSELAYTSQQSFSLSEDLSPYLASFDCNRPMPLSWGREKQLEIRASLLSAGRMHLYARHAKGLLRAIKQRILYGKPSGWCQKEPISEWRCSFQREMALAHPSLYSFDIPTENEEFVLFPLHLTPEASTMITSPEWVDQESLIKVLSKSVPMWCKLYVKEHNPMLGRRERSFYKAIRALPNVRLIDPWVDNRDLMKKARCIVTIAGTCAWEAMLFNKPVMVTGRAPFPVGGSGTICSDPMQMPTVLRSLCEYKELKSPDLRAAMIETLDRISVHGNFMACWDSIDPLEYDSTINAICEGVEHILAGRYPRGDVRAKV